MFNNIPVFQASRSYLPMAFMFFVVCVSILLPDLAHATDTSNSDLPFVTPLKSFTDALTGPVAFGISLVGIIAAGAVLIFGGEMSGFLRTLVFLVLVIAIIVNAGTLITFIKSDAATVAAQIDHSIVVLRAFS